MDGFADPCLFEPKCGVCGRLRQRHRPTPRLGLGVRATWLGWKGSGAAAVSCGEHSVPAEFS